MFPPLANVVFNETLVENYYEGQTINGFHCDPGFSPFPSDGIIKCGPNGWLEKPTCKLGESLMLFYSETILLFAAMAANIYTIQFKFQSKLHTCFVQLLNLKQFAGHHHK